jgi:hypothetical protein
VDGEGKHGGRVVAGEGDDLSRGGEAVAFAEVGGNGAEACAAIFGDVAEFRLEVFKTRGSSCS